MIGLHITVEQRAQNLQSLLFKKYKEKILDK
jgi:hypothetical protein